MEFKFELSENTFTEDEIISRYKKDWDFKRPSRRNFSKFEFTFPNPNNLQFFIAVCTSPTEYEGKIIAHSGVGEYEDLVVDGGTVTINPKFTGGFSFRRRGVARAARNVRDLLAEKIAGEKDAPYVLVVQNSEESYAQKYRDDAIVPSWAMDRIGNKFYMIFNPLYLQT